MMKRTLPLIVALSLVLMAVPPATAQVADPEVSVSSSEPVNQTTTVSVTAQGDGTSVLTVTTEGEITNETASATVPDDALAIVNTVINEIEEAVDFAIWLVIAVCDAVAGIFGATCM